MTRNGGDGPVYFADGFMYYRKGHPGATIFRAAVERWRRRTGLRTACVVE